MVDFSKIRGIPEYFLLNKYNITPDDVCRLYFNCEPQDIQEEVIITPCWFPNTWSDMTESVTAIYEDKVFILAYRRKKFTLIRSGIGAPNAGDMALALSGTPCRHIIFTGSFGGLTKELKIGDLLTITESVGGDGFSSYLKKGRLSQSEFLKPARPHEGLNKILKEHAAKETVKENGVTLHEGRIFSIDTIIGQFQHLDMITEKLGCIGIEMETSAVFNAAKLTGIPATALLIASDVITTNKSLFSGRTLKDREKYQQIKTNILTKIILETLSDKRLAKI
jgi:nucleoside phosphorylase